MNDRDKKCCMIQAKISATAMTRIEKIVKAGEFESKYEFLQYLLSAFLRFADPGGEDIDELSEELVAFAKIYEGWENKKQRIITTRPSGNRQLKMTDVINIYSEVGRKGYICKMLNVRGEDVRTSGSVVDAVDVVLKKLHPQMYAMMKDVGLNIGESASVRVIEYLLSEAKEKGLTAKEKAVSDAPTSNEYGNVPKKKRSKSLNDE
jgi:hypothetical protein